MKPQGLIAALVLLAALVGYAFWSNKHPDTSAATKADAASPKILTVAADQVESVRLKKPDAEPITLTKSGDAWQIAQEKSAVSKPLPADSNVIMPMLSALNPLTSDRLIDEHPTDLAAFGLDAPPMEVDLTLKGGKTRTLLLGAATPTNADIYTKVDGDAKVYTIAASLKSTFDKSAAELRDKTLLALNLDNTKFVSLAAKGAPFQMESAADEWQITKPKTMRADRVQVDELIAKIRDSKMELTPDGPDMGDDMKANAAAFASGTKVGLATFGDGHAMRTIEIRKSKDSFYAKTSALDGAYKVSAELAAALDKGIDDFRNKRLFDFAFNDPAKVDLNGKVYEKNGDKWFNGSTRIDPGSIQSVVDGLRELAAVKFADKVSGTPAYTIAVTWGEKARVEKIVLNKSGDDYYVTRDGDPTVYVVEGKMFGDVQQAIAAIAPYKAPADTKK